VLGNEKKTSAMIGGLGLWMCGERGDDDVSALFIYECFEEVPAPHCHTHKWKN
jgi:hypothetical protein